jgi:hypothetical protein
MKVLRDALLPLALEQLGLAIKDFERNRSKNYKKSLNVQVVEVCWILQWGV